jgi:hypothetical protein
MLRRSKDGHRVQSVPPFLDFIRSISFKQDARMMHSDEEG